VTIAEYLARAFARHGVERVFGFPGGGSNLDVIDAGIEFVLARSETGAALMAAATAELTGAPGAVLVGNGPGVTSVVNGVAHAYLDRVPLIVVSDRYTDAEAKTTGHQILDQRALLRPVVKWSATLASAATVERAFAIARTAPMGPVHLDLPRDLATAPAVEADVPAPSLTTPPLDAVAAALEGARRPVLLAGLEAADLDLTPLATRLGAAVLTTYKAKGVVADEHGILTGGALERPLLEQADVILAVGLDPVELLSREWTVPAPVVALRACESGLEYLRPHVTWVGDLRAGVAALVELLPGAPGYATATLAPFRPPDDQLTAWRVVEILREELPRTTTFTVDAGAHMFAATLAWRAHAPRQFLISNGLATMGFAVPAAVAAALARPEHPAVALTGDGGFAYHGFELETATRLGAKTIVVVLNDASLSLIRIKREALRDALAFGDVGFDRVAEGLGVASERVDTPDGVRTAIQAALARASSSLIEVRISGDEYAATLRAVRG
jgi:acetolactate synthase I/II/III large subunit